MKDYNMNRKGEKAMNSHLQKKSKKEKLSLGI